ncbi:MAG: hypothetical protein IPK81_03855 [Rhodospirillales bacterium]|nr:MAG: hypothetical protein IPK81_03855 [Rhodospirillales bacterium]
MPFIQRLHGKFAQLYQPQNYRFSTIEAGGARLSSFYYQDALGNQGRWRREHPQGTLITYQGQGFRLFVDGPDNYDEDECLDIIDHLRANPGVAGIPGHLPGAAHYSRAPQAGWHVIEATPAAVAARTVGHRSSGTVSLHDAAASMAGRMGINLFDIETVSDWTQMPPAHPPMVNLFT